MFLQHRLRVWHRVPQRLVCMSALLHPEQVLRVANEYSPGAAFDLEARLHAAHRAWNMPSRRSCESFVCDSRRMEASRQSQCVCQGPGKFAPPMVHRANGSQRRRQFDSSVPTRNGRCLGVHVQCRLWRRALHFYGVGYVTMVCSFPLGL